MRKEKENRREKTEGKERNWMALLFTKYYSWS